MKISINNLEQQLNNKILSLYWVAGDEPLLVQEASDKIRQQLKKAGYLNRNIFYLDNYFNWNHFIGETKNLSLFADLTLIELRLGDKKLTEIGRKILADYLQLPAIDKVILINSEKIDLATQKTKWFEAIETLSGFIAVWPLTSVELQRWIEHHLTMQQLSAPKAVIQLLAERGEGNLLAIKQDIEKLSLLYPKAELQMEAVSSVISDNTRFDIFALTDAALEKKSARVIKILKVLQQEGIEPILVLWALAREIRTLLALCETNNPLTETSLKKYGIWPKRIPLIKVALQHGSYVCYAQLLAECAVLDATIKGIKKGNVWDGLERISLSLAGASL